jgi:hypothetical protein
MIGGRWAVPLFNYSVICLTTEEKHGKTHSGSPRSVRHY